MNRGSFMCELGVVCCPVVEIRLVGWVQLGADSTAAGGVCLAAKWCAGDQLAAR